MSCPNTYPYVRIVSFRICIVLSVSMLRDFLIAKSLQLALFVGALLKQVLESIV